MLLVLMGLSACEKPDHIVLPEASIGARTRDVAIGSSEAMYVSATTWAANSNRHDPTVGPGVLFRVGSGSYDATFGNRGVLEVADAAATMAIARGPNDGCYVGVGVAQVSSEPLYPRLELFDPSGAVDQSFATQIIQNEGSPEQILDLAPADDGGVWVLSAGTRVWLSRYNPDGSVAGEWGDGGSADLGPCGEENLCWWGKLAALDDGSLVVGFAAPVVTTKLDPTGALDPAYGVGGVVTVEELFDGLGFGPEGQTLLYAVHWTGGRVDLAEIDADGTVQPLPPLALDKDVVVVDAAIDGDGRAWLAGRYGTRHRAAFRLTPEGTLDTGWQDAGMLIDPPGEQAAYFEVVTIGPQGEVGAVGSSKGSIVARWLSQGS
jgi:hypothetical protein